MGKPQGGRTRAQSQNLRPGDYPDEDDIDDAADILTDAPAGNDNTALAATGMRKGDLKRRFFVAVMPPATATAPMTALRGNGPSHWDWKGHDDYHISLAFPGLLGDAQLARLLAALATVQHEPFDAQFTGLAYFLRDPHARNRTAQNVLWARPDHAADNQLRSLHFKIARALAASHLDFGIKDITPHLTVAKVPANDNSLIESFAAAHDGHAVTGAWRCDRFGVYETLDKSDPRHPANNGGRGTRYVRVAEFMLRP